jgi:hypothetical protein
MAGGGAGADESRFTVEGAEDLAEVERGVGMAR